MNRGLPINEYPVNTKKLREYNFRKYKGVPPPWSLIETVLEKSGMRFMFKFELVFGIVQQSLKLYKNGHRGLPVIYWHIFYDFEAIAANRKKIRRIKTGTKNRSKSGTILGTNKNILHDIREESNSTG